MILRLNNGKMSKHHVADDANKFVLFELISPDN